MKQFQFKIDKDVWTIQLLSKEEYESLIGLDSEAQTDINQRIISFHIDRITKDVIEHEMTHTYFEKLCLRSCDNFTIMQMEEIIAEFVPRYARDIIKSSTKLKKTIDKTLMEE